MGGARTLLLLLSRLEHRGISGGLPGFRGKATFDWS